MQGRLSARQLRRWASSLSIVGSGGAGGSGEKRLTDSPKRRGGATALFSPRTAEGSTIAAENGRPTNNSRPSTAGRPTSSPTTTHYIKKARPRKVARAAKQLLTIDRNENKSAPLFQGVAEGGAKSGKKSRKIKGQ